MLLYALLHVTGYDLSLEELKNFRQWGSKTPGHPENHLTPGVEMATGPLGQGVATSVGMAIAEASLAAHTGIIDHYTYVLCSDGDLMEGVAQEAASLAGHLQLGKLIWLYDDNKISIDGSTEIAFTEDTGVKFAAMGWQVIRVSDGMDVEQIDAAIREAQRDSERPSLIICPTTIGFGSPTFAGSEKSHGSPLGVEEVRLTKLALGLPADEDFYLPNDALAEMRGAVKRGEELVREWDAKVAQSGIDFAKLVDPSKISLPAFTDPIATRNATGAALNAILPGTLNLLSGSADLSNNVFTTLKGAGRFAPEDRKGRNVAYGVREHAMAAAANGITLHGGCKAVCGTFLIFSDYCKPSIRLAALMQCPTLFTFSHDSIGLGEDGPTHQPIEQLAMLRAIPGLNVMRPADANETVACWMRAFEETHTPSLIATSRQALPIVTPAPGQDHPSRKGAYVIHEPTATPRLNLVASGSEVSLALKAAETLASEGIPTRVINLVSWHDFERLDGSERNTILDRSLPTMSVEAGSTMGWSRYADRTIGIDTFGASAPGPLVMEKFGFSVENVVAQAHDLVNSRQR